MLQQVIPRSFLWLVSIWVILTIGIPVVVVTMMRMSGSAHGQSIALMARV